MTKAVKVWIFWMISPLTIIFIIIYLFANDVAKWDNYDFTESSKNIFSRFDTFMGLFYNIITSLLLDFCFNNLLSDFLNPTLYNKCHSVFKSIFNINY